MNEERQLPAIPPDDYKGSFADWHYELIKRGYWDGEDPADICDASIPESEYDEILAKCERE